MKSSTSFLFLMKHISSSFPAPAGIVNHQFKLGVHFLKILSSNLFRHFSHLRCCDTIQIFLKHFT
ncbi:ORF1055 [White spot syndrome virus]|uniref:ORF1055 n=1 Tax=White spot syndrome virus TaxID=342409 RepID=A0A2D3I6T6_9VIRU|nr:ORF1055 [White spot syndrome virus]